MKANDGNLHSLVPMGLSTGERIRHHDRVRKGMARAYQERRVARYHLRRYRKEGRVSESLFPYVVQAEHEVEELLLRLGGECNVSPQRCALVEQYGYMGIVLRAATDWFISTSSPGSNRINTEAAATMRHTSHARERILLQIGLDAIPEVQTLDAYLASKQSEGPEAAAQSTIESGSDSSVEVEVEVSPERSSRSTQFRVGPPTAGQGAEAEDGLRTADRDATRPATRVTPDRPAEADVGGEVRDTANSEVEKQGG